MAVPLFATTLVNAYSTIEALEINDSKPDAFYRQAFSELSNAGDRELSELLHSDWETSYKKISKDHLDEFLGLITESASEESVLKQRKGNNVDLIRNSNRQHQLEVNKYNLDVSGKDISNANKNFEKNLNEFRSTNEGAVLDALKNVV